MSTEKKLTAVEYLESKIFGDEVFSLSKVFEKAKEMHKQQIIDAFDDGQANYTLPRDFDNGKEYYEETYKKD